mgnify:CR=1 FL=1
MPAAAEWQLQPSRQQRRLNAITAIALCLFALLTVPLLLPVALLLSVLLFWPGTRVTRLGVDASGWWLDQGAGRQYVEWRAGSIRRRYLVLLNWSWRPWESVIIRADSVRCEDDFRRLKAALYQSWH